MLQWSQLKDSNRNVRNAALETLAKLEPARLAQYAGAVVARLEDSHYTARATRGMRETCRHGAT